MSEIVPEIWFVGGVIGLAAFVQSLTGFGFALVAVSLLPLLMDLHTAVALVVMASVVSNFVLCYYYRDSFDWQSVVRLIAAALLTIPLGIVGLQYVPDHLALRILGGLVLAYVLYDGLKFALPELTSPAWAYAFGAMSGVLTGAFNTGGPPIVIYANCNSWSPEQFKGNIPGVFMASSLIAMAGHYFQGSLTIDLLQVAVYAMPFFVGGLVLGIVLSTRINPRLFRQVVLVLLGAMSLRLIW
ncbi:MAG: sulfite exporter TauE/SafE family protein [Cyanobacteria bacterium P01_A01_bin.114]